MKWALAGLLAMLAVVAVGFVLVVAANRDPVPDALRGCVLDGGAGVMLSEGDLGAQVRSDLEAQAVRELSRSPVGEDTAVLLAGTNFRLLVLLGRGSPEADGNLPLQVYERTAEFALVAKEVDPQENLLRGCVGLVAERQ
ncbi:MAG: hypothetical protein H0V81_03355 [Solirubrobacterales bacterium]|nr:hypothetical protein [Solirubrobacterales bacterium]